jgi:nucleoside-diphosphate-sugar epimerase
MKKILVCGATGFIGRNIVEHFARSGEVEVYATHFSRPPYAGPNVHWHQADLRSWPDVQRVMCGMDVVIQAAATTSGARDILERPALHVTDNAVMNSYLLRGACDSGVRHFVFFSCTVMYPSSPAPLKESDWDPAASLHPRYFGAGNTKVYIEKMCEFYAGIAPCIFTVIRHSNIFGPHDKFDLERSHVTGATISKVMTAEDRVTVWGTGAEGRDLLYVDDLVRFVELALERQRDRFKLYHCGSGQAVSVADLVKRVVERSGRSLRIEYDVTKPTIPTSLCLDCSLAERDLGWRPQVGLAAGLDRTLDWWRKNIDPATLKSRNGG